MIFSPTLSLWFSNMKAIWVVRKGCPTVPLPISCFCCAVRTTNVFSSSRVRVYLCGVATSSTSIFRKMKAGFLGKEEVSSENQGEEAFTRRNSRASPSCGGLYAVDSPGDGQLPRPGRGS